MVAHPPRHVHSLVTRFREMQDAGRIGAIHKSMGQMEGVARSLLSEERLKKLTTQEADTLYRSLPVPQRRRLHFLSNPIEEIRDALWFLLFEEAPYEVRVWEVLDEMGGYRLKGADLHLVAALLSVHDPSAFAPITPAVERGLHKLGLFPRFSPGESHAGRFQKLQETLWQLQAAAGLQDARETNAFLECVTRGLLEV